MNPRVSRALRLALCCALFCAAPACNPRDSVRVGGSTFPAEPPEGMAAISGTVIDLASGEPAAKAVVSFDGRETRTDAEGRFELAGLKAGAQGMVLARSGDGREATLALLPLGRERREIVLSIPAR